MQSEAAGKETVRLERQDGVAILTLDRPGAKNAIDPQTTDRLAALLHDLRIDDSVRSVVLTGAGGDFCAGGDVKGMGPRTPEQRRAGMWRYRELAERFAAFDKPLVCAVDGVAFGAGLSMALWADIVLVSHSARLAMVFHRIGLVPDLGAWWTLPRAVGLPRARELIYSAREFGAQEAVRLGIALESCAPDALMSRALVLAHAFASGPSTAFSLSKAALSQSMHSDLSSVLDLEATAQAVAGSSDYFQQAMHRFVEKKPQAFHWPTSPVKT